MVKNIFIDMPVTREELLGFIAFQRSVKTQTAPLHPMHMLGAMHFGAALHRGLVSNERSRPTIDCTNPTATRPNKNYIPPFIPDTTQTLIDRETRDGAKDLLMQFAELPQGNPDIRFAHYEDYTRLLPRYLDFVYRYAPEIEQKGGHPVIRAELIGSNDFNGKNLDYANLTYMQLPASNFSGATLRHAGAGEADFSAATFHNAQIQSTTFSHCNFTQADFTGAIMLNTNYILDNLTGARFIGAHITNDSFEGSNLSNANFSGAVLSEISFANTDCTNTTFQDALVTDVITLGAKNLQLPSSAQNVVDSWKKVAERMVAADTSANFCDRLAILARRVFRNRPNKFPTPDAEDKAALIAALRHVYEHRPDVEGRSDMFEVLENHYSTHLHDVAELLKDASLPKDARKELIMLARKGIKGNATPEEKSELRDALLHCYKKYGDAPGENLEEFLQLQGALPAPTAVAGADVKPAAEATKGTERGG